MMSKAIPSSRKMSEQYGAVNVESDVETADPHRLVAMLLDGAMVRIAKARVEIEQGRIEEKITHLTQAVAIVDSLRASLNMDSGSDIVNHLEALYDYMTRQLVLANSQNSIEILDEVTQLLKEIDEAWRGIRPEVSAIKRQPVESELDREVAGKVSFSASV